MTSDPQQPNPNLIVFEGSTIRRLWLEDRWYFSVVDVVGLVAESGAPRKYWSAMKARITDEGFTQLLTRCRSLKVPAADGKSYETDCADFATMMAFLSFLPAWGRSRRDRLEEEGSEEVGDAGIYAITNIMTHEQYIGSSANIPLRFGQHRAHLRQGKHHSKRLQAAWDRDGADHFRFEVLEHIPDLQLLPVIEQDYLDRYQPAYNSASFALNSSATPPISADRLRAVFAELYENSESDPQSPLFSAIKEAMMMGALRPGPNFHLLLATEQASITRNESRS